MTGLGASTTPDSTTPDSTTPDPASRPPSLWRLPAFRRRFAASAISRLGDFVFDTTVVIWIAAVLAKGQPWAPAAVSGVLVAATVPVLVIGPVAGVICDQLDRHAILMWSNIVQAVAIASLLLVPALGGVLGVVGQLAWVYVAILVTNAAAQFFAPASVMLLKATVPDERLTEAFSVQGSANAAIAMIGPPLAAPLLFAFGVEWALVIDAATFVVSCVLLHGIVWDSRPKPAAAGSTIWSSLVEGVSVIGRNRMLVALLTGSTVAMLGIGIINTLEVFFLTDVLRVPAELVGVQSMIFAGGMILGVAAAPRVERMIGAERAFVGSLALIGIGTVAYSRTRSFWLACVVMALIAVPLGTTNTVTSPLFMRTVPGEVLGRAAAAMNVLPTAASLIAIGGTGWLASTVMRGVDVDLGITHLGPVDTLFGLAGLLMVGAAAVVARPLLGRAMRDKAEAAG